MMLFLIYINIPICKPLGAVSNTAQTDLLVL